MKLHHHLPFSPSIAKIFCNLNILDIIYIKRDSSRVLSRHFFPYHTRRRFFYNDELLNCLFKFSSSLSLSRSCFYGWFWTFSYHKSFTLSLSFAWEPFQKSIKVYERRWRCCDDDKDRIEEQFSCKWCKIHRRRSRVPLKILFLLSSHILWWKSKWNKLPTIIYIPSMHVRLQVIISVWNWWDFYEILMNFEFWKKKNIKI